MDSKDPHSGTSDWALPRPTLQNLHLQKAVVEHEGVESTFKEEMQTSGLEKQEDEDHAGASDH